MPKKTKAKTNAEIFDEEHAQSKRVFKHLQKKFKDKWQSDVTLNIRADILYYAVMFTEEAVFARINDRSLETMLDEDDVPLQLETLKLFADSAMKAARTT